MPEQALYLKWRPQTFEDVIGQEHIIRTLRNAMRADRVRHAYLFSGPRGTGKTTTARLLAKAVNCQNPDVSVRPCNACPACIAVNESRYLDLIEIDAATHTGVDDVRDLRDKIAFAPGEGHFKIYIIDEVHRFSGSAFDALLKTLEEPPEHAIFVLATTEIDKVPQTIKSRCLQFEFRRFTVREVADRLERICESEGLSFEREALEMVAREGTGSMRDSISLLDQIVTDPEEAITVDLVQRVLGTASSLHVRSVADTLISGDAAGGLRALNEAIDDGADPRQLGQGVVEHLRRVLIAQTAGTDMLEASQDEKARYTQQAGLIQRSTLIRALKIFNEAVSNLKGGWQPQLALEIALIEALRGPVQEMVVPAEAQPARQPIAPEPVLPEANDLPVTETQPGDPPLVSADSVREQWEMIKRVVNSKNRNVPALLEHCRVIRVDGDRIILGASSDIFREKLEAPDKRDALERALGDIFRIRLRVQVITMRADGTVGEDPSLRQDPVYALGRDLGATRITHLQDEDEG